MRLVRLLLVLAIALATLAAPSAVGAEPVFGEPSASAPLGEPVVVTSTINGVEEGSTVEVLLGMDGREQKIVVTAAPAGGPDEWSATAEIDVPTAVDCTCYASGQSAPNSPIQFQFRVRAPDGGLTFGPVGNTRVEDDRFDWQTLEQGLVRVHWYEGDQAFAQTAADVANSAIDRAAELLGSTLPEPVDLFIYATQDALLEAVSPARENIAGEAHLSIQTMFVWIGPNDDRRESDVTIAHELTHLVFRETTFNRYHEPPRWLNEGVAVYLSEGYSESFRSVVEVSALTGELIPLQGLAGLFPAGEGFFLAYGESVSAVDFFVNTYSEETLWNLVRSYANGLSDDEAFEAATGDDLAAFNAAWMQSLDTDVREPVGPQPAPPGPLPSGWSAEGQPTPPPSLPVSATQDPSATPAPGATATPRPEQTPPPVDDDDDSGAFLVALVVGIAALVAVLVGFVVITRGRKPRAVPPQPLWPPQPPQPPQPPHPPSWPPSAPPAAWPPSSPPPGPQQSPPPSRPPGWE